MSSVNNLSDQQKADQNLATFLSWVASKTDANFRKMARHGQGSQFPRIILPVRHSRLLDRTLLYTAITRAQHQVILVGDVAAAKAAVEAPPHASLRQVALGSLLTEILEGRA